MDLVQLMNAAPRCSATSKRSRQQCRAPAVRGWKVCRFHGARGGAPKGKANGAWRHGRFTSEVVMLRRLSAILTRGARKTMEKLAVFSATFSNIAVKPATNDPVLKGTARRST